MTQQISILFGGADHLARSWKHGMISATLLTQALVERGFYDITIREEDKTVAATYNGVVFVLGVSPAAPARRLDYLAPVEHGVPQLSNTLDQLRRSVAADDRGLPSDVEPKQ